MTNERLLKRTIVKEVIQSKFLQENRTLRIYLPPGYNEILSYPVVYCQDGEEFFNFGRIATWANQLILEEGVEPFIIVGVEVNTKVRTEEYAPFGNRFDAYLSCFAEEIIPFIEQNYPVRREPSERVLAGDSLGGSVSVHLALRYPQLFTRIISLSGAFYEKSQDMIREEADLSWLDIYMIVGLQEDNYTTDTGVYNFVELNRSTKALLEERGARISYLEKDGRHLWGFWQKELPAALMYFLG
ncbi:putative esterase [Paenibacillus vortex V453]|uniref:Enterochelin esterase n=2 Tax=Paenibacillus TaxID=44249 RepID=A0A163LPH8_9BACL|nr:MULTISPECIES: alpha/beta hydrolase-fold protein [Paenibacillus]ANA82217.1 enterochelin esterase [Paenibacillus glucanolyticus]AVV59045.1 esterase family protein [Paenibacillus glucanolyticus]AWP28212.1 enterochelin esterase [Paenibacillus sp. Cedars]EFU41272.1 putative esterase [Paenibacillus vortex V453]ETT41638.1 putative esterase [Paenibacillus sp. FSL R5-808]